MGLEGKEAGGEGAWCLTAYSNHLEVVLETTG